MNNLKEYCCVFIVNDSIFPIVEYINAESETAAENIIKEEYKESLMICEIMFNGEYLK